MGAHGASFKLALSIALKMPSLAVKAPSAVVLSVAAIAVVCLLGQHDTIIKEDASAVVEEEFAEESFPPVVGDGPGLHHNNMHFPGASKVKQPNGKHAIMVPLHHLLAHRPTRKPFSSGLITHTPAQ